MRRQNEISEESDRKRTHGWVKSRLVGACRKLIGALSRAGSKITRIVRILLRVGIAIGEGPQGEQEGESRSKEESKARKRKIGIQIGLALSGLWVWQGLWPLNVSLNTGARMTGWSIYIIFMLKYIFYTNRNIRRLKEDTKKSIRDNEEKLASWEREQAQMQAEMKLVLARNERNERIARG